MSRLTLSLAAIVAIAGCSTAPIEDRWRASSGPELTRVVTLSTTPDGAHRRSIEARLAHQLRSYGVRAVPGYVVLPERARYERGAMLAALRADGFDGVVAMRVVDGDRRLVYSYAYAVTTDQLVWSAMSESDPSASADAMRDVSGIVSSRLAHDGVIGAEQAMRTP